MSTLKEKAEQILQEKEEKIIAENIKKDIQIFDITGNLEEGIDTSDATALENDIVEGKTAYTANGFVEGTIRDFRTGMENAGADINNVSEDGTGKLIMQGAMNFEDIVTTDGTPIDIEVQESMIASAIGLIANKIKKNENVLGVIGTLETTGIDTSDATATENDLVEGTSAYVNGVKIDGTLYDERYESGYYSFDNIGVVNNPETKNLETSGDLTLPDGYTGVVLSKNMVIGYDIPYNKVSSAIGLNSNVIAQGHTVLGVEGTFEGTDTSDATATASDIVENTSAYVDGVKLDGTLKDSREQSTIPYTGSAYYGTNYGTTSTVIFKLPQNTPDLVVSSENEFIGNINNANFANSIGLTANKIKKDETILGVTGTYEGSGSATTVNTTLNFQIGETSSSFENLPYITSENLKSATFDITQLYNWNRNNGNGTPISQTILEMPYVYLKLEITEHHELAGGFEVMYELVALDKPLIYSYNEYDSEAQVAKNCYKASMQSGVFTNTEYNTETSEDELIPGMNYTTFEEFWTAFCGSLYNDSNIRCIKPTRTTTYEADAMMGYLYSNLV